MLCGAPSNHVDHDAAHYHLSLDTDKLSRAKCNCSPHVQQVPVSNHIHFLSCPLLGTLSVPSCFINCCRCCCRCEQLISKMHDTHTLTQCAWVEECSFTRVSQLLSDKCFLPPDLSIKINLQIDLTLAYLIISSPYLFGYFHLQMIACTVFFFSVSLQCSSPSGPLFPERRAGGVPCHSDACCCF